MSDTRNTKKSKKLHRTLSVTRSNARTAPLILISPNTEVTGDEFGGTAHSVSETYQRAVIRAGGLPVVLTGFAESAVIEECVRRCDGVLFTGGEDVNPRLYTKRLPAALRRTVRLDAGDRDERELMLVEEVFRQRKPLFAVCRGHQMVNVALGGSLVVDIASQLRGALNHRQMKRKSEVVHQARLTEGSLLANITGKRRLGVNSTHHQAVARVASVLRVTASSPDGVVEGLELKAGQQGLLPYFVTVQFHPERLAPRHAEHQALFDSFVRACAQSRN